jgi:GNAT superfamily N-acetyltransferase
VNVRLLAGGEVDAVLATGLGLERLHQGDGSYLVAWDGADPLGHCYVALGDPLELQDVSVRPEHRRRGVASALTHEAERVVRSHGHDRLTLTVGESNVAAQAVYRSLGFTPAAVPARRVTGMVQVRSGTLEVDEVLLTWEKRVDSGVARSS